MSQRISAGLLALPFLGVGIAMLILVSTTLSTWFEMKDWSGVQAQIITGGYEMNGGKSGYAYKAYATYTYTFNGQKYKNNRVSISDMSDNIGHFQKKLGNRLSVAQNTKASIEIFVNPQSPTEAVIDRSLRWEVLAFNSLFLILFGWVGARFLWYAFSPTD